MPDQNRFDWKPGNWRTGGDPLKHQEWQKGGDWRHGGDWNHKKYEKEHKETDFNRKKE